MIQLTKRTVSVLALAVALTACSKDSDQNGVEDQLAAQMEEAADKLEALGFDTSDLFIDEMQGQRGFVVERDIFLTMGDINSMSPAVSVQNNEVEVEHYRTTNTVSQNRVVTVYMDSDFNSTMQAAFDDALARYNALNLTLTFQRANSSGADIDILSERLGRVPGGGIILGRSAGFPDASGNPATPIVLNSQVYNRKRGGAPADAATVIAHEIGHAIGFRHTDYMDRSYSCGGSAINEGSADVGAVYIPGTPAGPENGSYMLACSDGTNRPFTSGDRTALTTIY